MENCETYVELGYGIPERVVMEILLAMRDRALPTVDMECEWFVKYKDGFGNGTKHDLALCLAANSQCVDLEFTRLNITTNSAGELVIYFNRK